jgi:hypothetical protein
MKALRGLAVLVVAVLVTMVWASAAVAAPVNDAPSGATEIGSLPYNTVEDVSTATTSDDPESSCGSGGFQGVWFVLTGAKGVIVADTTGSDYDTILTIYSVHPHFGLREVACNDDNIDLESNVTWRAGPNKTYYILASSYNDGEAGELHLSVATES